MATKRNRKSSSTDLAQAARWVFLAGLAISIVAGLVFSFPMGGDTAWQEWVVYLVLALGLVGGYLHIGKGSQHEFILIALGVAVFSDRLGYIPTVGNYLGSIFGMVGLFLAMAVMAIVVRNIVDWFRS
jgi:hypothetical protein